LSLALAVVLTAGCGVSDSTTEQPAVSTNDVLTPRLAFFNWEANVLGPAAELNSGAGGAARALRRQTQRWTERGRPPTEGENRQLIASGAEPTRADALRLAANEEKSGRSPQGTIVVAAQAVDPEGEIIPGRANRGFYVLNDDPAITDGEIRHPASEVDSEGQPRLTFFLSPKGRQAYEEMTKQVADQGRDRNQCPYTCRGPHIFNSYAIVFGSRVLSREFIDYTWYPDGMSANGGLGIDIPTIAEARSIATSLEAAIDR
jgi:hypothetical protein